MAWYDELVGDIKTALDAVYAPLGHNHNSLYYTKAEVDALIGGGTVTISLSADKSILSYYNSESAVLSATVLENGSAKEGATVEFFNGSTSMGTASTNSSGVATKTYASTGAGDVSFTASVGSLVSETYSIEDCLVVDPLTSDTGLITFATGTTYSFGSTNGLTLKSSSDAESMIGVTAVNNMEASAKIKWASSAGPLLSLHNSWVYRESTSRMSIIDMTNDNTAWSGRTQINKSTTTNTWYDYTVKCEGSVVSFYLNDTYVGQKTISTITPLKVFFRSNNNNVYYKDLKVKAL